MDADKLTVGNKREVTEKGQNLSPSQAAPVYAKTQPKATRVIPGDPEPPLR